MAIQFRRTSSQRMRAVARAALARTLDAVFAPVISRLDDDEYFACRTRSECLRAFARHRLAR